MCFLESICCTTALLLFSYAWKILEISNDASHADEEIIVSWRYLSFYAAEATFFKTSVSYPSKDRRFCKLSAQLLQLEAIL